MGDFDQRIRGLSAGKRELLALRLGRAGLTGTAKGDLAAPSGWPRSTSVAELSKEAALDADISPRDPNLLRAEQPAALLLTGATGFVGAFLLDELIARTRAEIHCLVRASDAAGALERVLANVRAYGLNTRRIARRVIPVLGDLSRPLLGLQSAAFSALADRIDGVFHCGAAVKWTYPYAALKAANVDGTREILRLATVRDALPVHFISTVGVFASASFQRDRVTETEPLEHAETLSVGYAQTKWVAERMVRNAAAIGLPVSIHRLATGGDSRTGAYNANDFISLAVKGCIQLGSAPDSDIPLQIAPVDFTARAVVNLALRSELLGQTFNLVNPRPVTWSELFDMVGELGWPLRRLPLPEWRAELVARSRSEPTNALAGLLPFLTEALDDARLPTFECTCTFEALAGSGIVCPPIDVNLVRTYLDHFVETGFIDASRNTMPGACGRAEGK